MLLLEYLVPSRARREMLRTLRSGGPRLSVRQLSRRTGVAYSNAHREVAQMRRAGVLRAERVGNAVLCSWNSGHPAAEAAARLLRDAESGRSHAPGDETLFRNLRRWGAPLVRTGSGREDLSLEETLAYGLPLARRHPEVARVWPVVLARHRSEVDLEDLAARAVRLGEKRALGFFLALTGRLLRDRGLSRAGRRLRDRRFRTTEDFFLRERGPRARALAERRTPSLARQWRFRMNMPLESFESHFGKHVGPP
jgi:DNA-binding transcriptional ArsR family regulator